MTNNKRNLQIPVPLSGGLNLTIVRQTCLVHTAYIPKNAIIWFSSTVCTA